MAQNAAVVAQAVKVGFAVEVELGRRAKARSAGMLDMVVASTLWCYQANLTR